MKLRKIVFALLFILGIVSLFLPWSTLDSDPGSAMTGFKLLIETPLSGSLTDLLGLSLVFLLVVEGYIIGLVLLLMHVVRQNTVLLFSSIACMAIGLAANFLLLTLQSFGGSMSHDVSYGVGYWLAVGTTLALLAWGVRGRHS